MGKVKFRLNCALLLLAAGLLGLVALPATAQTTPPPGTTATNPPETSDGTAGEDTGTPSTAHPPAYIGDLLKAGNLKQAQVDQMRTGGMGWGEIRIATRLAEQIAANSSGSLTFDAALSQVLADRAGGQGWGEIAAANKLKVGDLVNDKKAGDAAKNGKGQATSAAAKEKKPGFFAKVGRFLGFGKSDAKASTDVKGEKPEHPTKVDHANKPDKPEKPAAVERPERPEKPERGVNR